jgi:hypothetical protein
MKRFTNKFLTISLTCIAGLLLSARADAGAPAESSLWQFSALHNGTQNCKVKDFTYCNGAVYAITDTMDMFKYTPPVAPATTGTWALIPKASVLGTPIPDTAIWGTSSRGHYIRRLDMEWSSSVYPLLLSHNNKIYLTAKSGLFARGELGSANHYTWVEYNVLCYDPVAGTTSAALAVAGTADKKWACIYNLTGWTNTWLPAYEKAKSTLVDGYLFTDGTDVFWGGGGGGLSESDTNGDNDLTDTDGTGTLGPFPILVGNGSAVAAVGGVDLSYVWKVTSPGPAVLQDRIRTDQYARPVPMAMPNGYRYNHLVEFAGKFWDYYGYYEKTYDGPGGNVDFAFTPKTDGINTEPWGRFQMGTGVVDGASRLIRVAHNKLGNKNFLYSIDGAGGTWSKLTTGGGNPNNGSIYWRGCTVVENLDCGGAGAPTNTFDESEHSGLYATYSQKIGAVYSSGIYRYTKAAGVWGWSKVIDDPVSATTFTGGIHSIKYSNGVDAAKDLCAGVYVGTSNGVYVRQIGEFKDPDGSLWNGDETSVPPQP